MTATIQPLFASDDIALHFQRFDSEHPEVWTAIVRIVAHRADQGVRRLSMKLIIEQLRDQLDITWNHREMFKINNSYTALYSRKIASEYPQFAHLFRTRKRHI